MKLFFSALVSFYLLAPQAFAIPFGMLICESQDTNLKLEFTLPSLGFYSYILDITNTGATESLFLKPGSEPGMTGVSNAHFFVIESLKDNVLTIYVKKDTESGGSVRLFALPSTFSVDSGIYSFKAQVNILTPPMVVKNTLVDCQRLP